MERPLSTPSHAGRGTLTAKLGSPAAADSELRRPKIFIGLVEIAGFCAYLKQGFDELGIPTVFLNVRPHKFLYPESPAENVLLEAARWTAERRSASPARTLRRELWSFGNHLARLLVFAWAVVHFDTFIFCFGSTFYRYWELPVLKLLGKRTIHVFLGSDIRPPFLDGALFPPSSEFSPLRCAKLCRRRKKALRKIERYSSCVVSYPLYSQFLEKPFISIAFIGLPQPVSEAPSSPSLATDHVVRVLHAPSNPGAKGTDRIRGAIAAAKEAGLPIDYVELIGQPNARVREELAACDFVVDQCYSDVPMAGFAAEAVRYGKPAIVAGYAGAEFATLFPKGIPPTLYCHPDELPDAIKLLTTDVARRQSLGRAAQEFVRTVWSPTAVAARFVRLATGDAPDEWWCDPASINYLAGGGVEIGETRRRVCKTLEVIGPAAFQLGDKPELESRVMAFAASIG